jgi:small subunit ribosomal protein S11
MRVLRTYNASFNNTIVTITDKQGNTLLGQHLAVLALVVQEKVLHLQHRLLRKKPVKKRVEFWIKSLEVLVKGPGPGRDSAVRALNSVGYKITNIKDITPLPHNGCRPPKKRRV